MAKEHSEKFPFQSRYGGEYITAANFLAESMVAKQARTKGIDLPHKFWNLDRWKRDYKLQLLAANTLLKLYSPETIIRAMRTPEGKRAYSLKAKWLDPLFKEEQGRLNRLASQPTPPAPPEATLAAEAAPPRPAFTPNKSTLDKLRGLDG